MAKLSTYALAGALAFALAPVAGYAADLPEPPLLEPAPEPVEFGSAWYLRGDVGYKNYRNPDARFTSNLYPGNPNMVGEKLKNAAVIGGGVGYKVNEWIRTDVTVDYETKAKFNGDLYATDLCVKGCGSHESAKLSAWTFFWNGYVDIATFKGFTPYVGGGIGVARLDITNYKSEGFGGPICGGKCPTSNYKGDERWNFAWNLQAGVGFNVTDNLLIDANYRFVDLGKARTGRIPGANGGHVEVDNVQAHEFRVGFRYMLD